MLHKVYLIHYTNGRFNRYAMRILFAQLYVKNNSSSDKILEAILVSPKNSFLIINIIQ